MNNQFLENVYALYINDKFDSFRSLARYFGVSIQNIKFACMDAFESDDFWMISEILFWLKEWKTNTSDLKHKTQIILDVINNYKYERNLKHMPRYELEITFGI